MWRRTQFSGSDVAPSFMSAPPSPTPREDHHHHHHEDDAAVPAPFTMNHFLARPSMIFSQAFQEAGNNGGNVGNAGDADGDGGINDDSPRNDVQDAAATNSWPIGNENGKHRSTSGVENEIRTDDRNDNDEETTKFEEEKEEPVNEAAVDESKPDDEEIPPLASTDRPSSAQQQQQQQEQQTTRHPQLFTPFQLYRDENAPLTSRILADRHNRTPVNSLREAIQRCAMVVSSVLPLSRTSEVLERGKSERRKHKASIVEFHELVVVGSYHESVQPWELRPPFCGSHPENRFGLNSDRHDDNNNNNTQLLDRLVRPAESLHATSSSSSWWWWHPEATEQNVPLVLSERAANPVDIGDAAEGAKVEQQNSFLNFHQQRFPRTMYGDQIDYSVDSGEDWDDLEEQHYPDESCEDVESVGSQLGEDFLAAAIAEFDEDDGEVNVGGGGGTDGGANANAADGSPRPRRQRIRKRRNLMARDETSEDDDDDDLSDLADFVAQPGEEEEDDEKENNLGLNAAAAQTKRKRGVSAASTAPTTVTATVAPTIRRSNAVANKNKTNNNNNTHNQQPLRRVIKSLMLPACTGPFINVDSLRVHPLPLQEWLVFPVPFPVLSAGEAFTWESLHHTFDRDDFFSGLIEIGNHPSSSSTETAPQPPNNNAASANPAPANERRSDDSALLTSGDSGNNKPSNAALTGDVHAAATSEEETTTNAAAAVPKAKLEKRHR